LVPAIATYQLRKEDFHAIVDGMEMDARGPIVAPTTQVLNQYCDRVASAVGRLCVRAFGESTPAGDRVADHLGRALQLTNIMRDVEEDSAIGRLYLPAELLERAGIAIASPADVISDPRLPQVLKTLGQYAEDAFVKTQDALAECPKNTMRPAVIMMMVYRKHLDRLRANGWQPPPPQVGLARVAAHFQKLWIAVRYGFL
jgi:phytoene synthase